MSEETENRSSKRGLVIGVIGLVLLLAAAAFVGGRLLGQPQEEAGPDALPLPPGAGLLGEDEFGAGPQMFALPEIVPAAELPARPADYTGLFVDRQDDLLVIGTGNVSAFFSNDPDAAPEFNYDGVQVEVLVTNETELYEDITGLPVGQSSVQQQVRAVDSLDDLDENSTVLIWGRQQGDRIVAEVLAYSKMPLPPLQ
jgi:hypothetical protein